MKWVLLHFDGDDVTGDLTYGGRGGAGVLAALQRTCKHLIFSIDETVLPRRSSEVQNV